MSNCRFPSFKILLLEPSQALSSLIDSGADTNIIGKKLAGHLGIDLEPKPLPAQALDGHLLGTVTHQMKPVDLLMLRNHYKTIRFHVLPSPH